MPTHSPNLDFEEEIKVDDTLNDSSTPLKISEKIDGIFKFQGPSMSGANSSHEISINIPDFGGEYTEDFFGSRKNVLAALDNGRKYNTS